MCSLLTQESGVRSEVEDSMKDKLTHETIWRIKKYASDEDFKKNRVYEEKIIKGNILLNDGIGLLWDLGIGVGGTPFDNAHSRIGVGDSTIKEDATQIGLQGNHRAYSAMCDVSYPSRNITSVTWKAIFYGTSANFDWNEFVIDNGTTTLNRKVSAQGTKTSGQIWTVEVTITIN